MIARSPTDLQPVLDAIAERAAKLCDAEDAAIFRVDGNFLRLAAHFGPIPMADTVGEGRVIGSWHARWSSDCRRRRSMSMIFEPPKLNFRVPRPVESQWASAQCSSTPLLREGIAIGAIHIRRREVRPFSDRQIKLLETFADQAVIAIENAGLFTSNRRAIATSPRHWSSRPRRAKSCGVIASSPTDIQPVLNTVAESAARLCEADNAQIFRLEGDRYLLAASLWDDSLTRGVI